MLAVKSILLLSCLMLPKAQAEKIVRNTDSQIYYYGRWDKSPGTWWAGTGFKLNVQNLKSLALNLGPHTNSPTVPIGVSLDYEAFVTVNISAGNNVLPLDSSESTEKKSTVVRINSWGWQNNRVNLESIALNADAKLLPYTLSRLTFQFIGDSLSAGQYLPQGVDQAWPFLVGEAFKAEHVVIAQPGIALTDIVSYGNPRGMSVQFFKTEDSGYYHSTDHNYTTPWDFSRDVPPPNAIILHLGANDNGQNVPADTFVQASTLNYLVFLGHLRKIYRTQPLLILTPWGWPQPDGTVGYYYQGKYEEILNHWKASGDHNTFLVNTTGWVTYDDIFHDNLHPTVAGHQKIADLFGTWLKDFGIHPQKLWATEVN